MLWWLFCDTMHPNTYKRINMDGLKIRLSEPTLKKLRITKAMTGAKSYDQVVATALEAYKIPNQGAEV